MYAEIVSAVQSAKALSELLKAAQELSNYNDFVAAVHDINEKLMAATAIALSSQEKQSELNSRIHQLENELRSFQEFAQKLEKYRLHKFPTGSLAYIYTGQEEPEHFICSTCVGNKKATILQGEGRGLRCHVCQTQISTQGPPPYNSRREGSSWMSS